MLLMALLLMALLLMERRSTGQVKTSREVFFILSSIGHSNGWLAGNIELSMDGSQEGVGSVLAWDTIRSRTPRSSALPSLTSPCGNLFLPIGFRLLRPLSRRLGLCSSSAALHYGVWGTKG